MSAWDGRRASETHHLWFGFEQWDYGDALTGMKAAFSEIRRQVLLEAKMNKSRTPIPDDVSAEVMFQQDRTCCVCRERGLAVQIHHVDENPTNHAICNLAVLCLEHHEQTQTRGGFAKKLRAVDVVRYRDDWIRRVSDRRDKADEFVVKHMAGVLPAQAEPEYWNEPSDAKVIGFFNALPNIRRAALAVAGTRWDSGVTSEMLQGSDDAIESLERAWLQLAKFYPPRHFGEKSTDRFFSEFISERFAWHRLISEPRGPGSSGTLVNITAGGAVLNDMANAIAETVEGLYVGLVLDDFDLRKWRDEWDAAGKRDDPQFDSDGGQTSQQGQLSIIIGSSGAFESKSPSCTESEGRRPSF